MSKIVSIVTFSASLLVACGGAVTPPADSTASDDAGSAQDAAPDVDWDGALPPNSGEGTIGGVSFTVASAADSEGAFSWDTDNAITGVMLSSGPNVCSEDAPAAGESWLVIALIKIHPMDFPKSLPLPGTVPVMNEAAANVSEETYIGAAFFMHRSLACQAMPDDDATGGTLTLYEIGDATVAGAFDIDFPDGHASGTFNAAECASFGGNGCN